MQELQEFQKGTLPAMAVTRAHINPKMLAWARRRVNVDPELLAKRAGVSADAFAAWEEGAKRPTIRQLQKIAKTLRQPVGLFYLNSPPEEDQPRLAMRRVFGASPEADSHLLALEVQECVRRREIALELYERLDEEPPELPLRLTLNDDPEEAGAYVRGMLDVGVGEQVHWRNDREALKSWRTALERTGVLSFQMSGVELAEARGFAIAERPLPITAFNAKDSVRGRIFTLMHELAHVLLGSDVLHGSAPLEAEQEEERWCNRLAAAVLVPKDDLLSLQQVRERNRPSAWKGDEVRALARRYRVSPAVMIRRLGAFDLVVQGTYEALREEYDTWRASEEEAGGGSFYNNVLARLGTLLPTLAFRGFYADALGARDLSRIMGTKIKNLGEFEERVVGASHSFQAE